MAGCIYGKTGDTYTLRFNTQDIYLKHSTILVPIKQKRRVDDTTHRFEEGKKVKILETNCPGDPEPYAVAAIVGRAVAAIRRPNALRVAAPRPAAENTVGARGYAVRVALTAGRISAVPVGTPLPNVAAHVMQAEGVGAVEAADLYGLLAVLARYGVVFFVFFRPNKVYLRRVSDVFSIAKPDFFPALPGRKLPLVLRGQAVAVGVEFAGYDPFLVVAGAGIVRVPAAFVYGICRGEVSLWAEPVAVFHGVVPVHVDDGPFAAPPSRVAWFFTPGSGAEGIEIVESDFGFSEVKFRDRDGMLGFVATALSKKVAHREGAAGYARHSTGHGAAIGSGGGSCGRSGCEIVLTALCFLDMAAIRVFSEVFVAVGYVAVFEGFPKAIVGSAAGRISLFLFEASSGFFFLALASGTGGGIYFVLRFSDEAGQFRALVGIRHLLGILPGAARAFPVACIVFFLSTGLDVATIAVLGRGQGGEEGECQEEGSE